MNELAPCPCGAIPECISVQENGQGWKYMLAVPSCCGEWLLEFHTHYKSGEELIELAERAWNSAPRWCDTTRGQDGC